MQSGATTERKVIRVETDKEKAMRCIRNVITIENEVGRKEKKFQEGGEMLRKLRGRRDNLDIDIKDKMEELYMLERKSPDFTFDEFKKYCSVKVSMEDEQKERMNISKRIAQLEKESKKLKSDIDKSFNRFKTFAFMMKKLL